MSSWLQKEQLGRQSFPSSPAAKPCTPWARTTPPDSGNYKTNCKKPLIKKPRTRDKNQNSERLIVLRTAESSAQLSGGRLGSRRRLSSSLTSPRRRGLSTNETFRVRALRLRYVILGHRLYGSVDMARSSTKAEGYSAVSPRGKSSLLPTCCRFSRGWRATSWQPRPAQRFARGRQQDPRAVLSCPCIGRPRACQ